MRKGEFPVIPGHLALKLGSKEDQEKLGQVREALSSAAIMCAVSATAAAFVVAAAVTLCVAVAEDHSASNEIQDFNGKGAILCRICIILSVNWSCTKYYFVTYTALLSCSFRFTTTGRLTPLARVSSTTSCGRPTTSRGSGSQQTGTPGARFNRHFRDISKPVHNHV